VSEHDVTSPLHALNCLRQQNAFEKCLNSSATLPGNHHISSAHSYVWLVRSVFLINSELEGTHRELISLLSLKDIHASYACISGYIVLSGDYGHPME